MRIVPWSDAADMILVDVPGCEWPMAQQKMIEAAREFFGDSRAWVVECSPLVTASGVPDYPVLDIRDTVGVSVRSAYVDDAPLTPCTPEQFNAVARAGGAPGFPRYCTWKGDSLWLNPVPSETGRQIVATISVKPTLTAKGLPVDLWEQHIESIVRGAKYRLFISTKKPYSDPGAASTEDALFRDDIASAIIAAEDGGMGAPARVRPHFY